MPETQRTTLKEHLSQNAWHYLGATGVAGLSSFLGWSLLTSAGPLTLTFRFATQCDSRWSDAFSCGVESDPCSRHKNLIPALFASIGRYCEASTSAGVAIALVLSILCLAAAATYTAVRVFSYCRSGQTSMFAGQPQSNYGAAAQATIQQDLLPANAV